MAINMYKYTNGELDPITGRDIPDIALDDESTNSVQNKVISEKFDEIDESIAMSFKISKNYPNSNINLSTIAGSGYTPNANQLISFKVTCPNGTYGSFLHDGTEVAVIQNNTSSSQNEIFEVTVLVKANSTLKFTYGGSGVPTIQYGRVLMYC